MSQAEVLQLREAQDLINKKIAELLLERLKISHQILALKTKNQTALHDPKRVKELIEKVFSSLGKLDESERDYLSDCFRLFCDKAEETFLVSLEKTILD